MATAYDTPTIGSPTPRQLNHRNLGPHDAPCDVQTRMYGPTAISLNGPDASDVD